MKKRLFLLSLLLLLSAVPGCGNRQQDSENTDAAAEEEETPPAPGEETWGTAPEYSAALISTTPVRYLSVTVGSTEEEVNLTWFSPSESAGSVYWTSPDDTEFANEYVFTAEVTPSETISGYYINRATVTGLTPESEYLYQVGNEEGMSPSYSYTTPAFSDTFRFTAVGDAQIGKPVEEVDNQKTNWKRVLNKIKYHFPDTSFLVSLGDQVNDYNDTEQYNAFMNQGVLYSLSLAPLKGNHEIGGSQFSEHYTFPNLSSYGTCDDEGDGDYWFTRGNALFLVLDMMDPAKLGEHKEFIASAVEANPDREPREATITLKADNVEQIITVLQAGHQETNRVSIVYSGEQFTVPLITGEYFMNAYIWWGDDSEREAYREGAVHAYDGAGPYTVVIESAGAEEIALSDLVGVSEIDLSEF